MDDSPVTPRPPAGRRPFCRLHGPELRAPLTAVVVTAGPHAASLYLPAAPPGGTALWLEPDGYPGWAVPVRLARAYRDGPRGFLAGCAFGRPLDDEELGALLGGPPDE